METTSVIHFFILFKIFRRCAAIISKDITINEGIRDKEIRLIDADGSQLGIMPTKEALKIAYSKGLDLVKVAPQAKPPVCRIMDYGKYRFELAKKEKEAKKKQHVINVKEVRISPSIEEHDLNTKINHALKFLKSGDKVKVTVRFRGREVRHSSIGEELLTKFADSVSDIGTVEKKPKLEGRNMAMYLAPKQ